MNSNRFLTFVRDVIKLRSSNGQCIIIANAADWRLKAGGGGVNSAIYSAVGPDLERATKKWLKPSILEHLLLYSSHNPHHFILMKV
ncbi:unnamed protein product [Calypogeia fissa]